MATAAFPNDVTYTFRREPRIDWHIRGTGFYDAVNGDRTFETFVKEDADTIASSDTLLNQHLSQLIRSSDTLGIAQVFFLEAEYRRIRIPFRGVI